MSFTNMSFPCCALRHAQNLEGHCFAEQNRGRGLTHSFAKEIFCSYGIRTSNGLTISAIAAVSKISATFAKSKIRDKVEIAGHAMSPVTCYKTDMHTFGALHGLLAWRGCIRFSINTQHVSVQLVVAHSGSEMSPQVCLQQHQLDP